MILLKFRLITKIGIVALTASWLGQLFTFPVQAQLGNFCWNSPEAIAQKAELRKNAIAGDATAKKQYQELIQQQARNLQQCRNQTWPQTQATWLRLYPCDLRAGGLDDLMDRVVDKGYNQVYVEVLYDGQVLLPQSDNATPWSSIVWAKDQQDADLLAMSIKKGQERGLKVYAWVFTLNFGYAYGQRPDRQPVLARNFQGKTTLNVVDDAGVEVNSEVPTTDQAFVDPYSPQAQQDLAQVVEAALKRRPDGVLFDYVRYKRGAGKASIVSNARDLWIYGESSRQAMIDRGLNNKGREIIQRFLQQGFITTKDIQAIDRLYPKEKEPLWQSRKSSSQSLAILQRDLWLLGVSHAFEGVVSYLTKAIQPVLAQGIPAGAVFFPEGNQIIRDGFDSRLQAWDRFPGVMEWHPMSYGVCGNPTCIVAQVQRVLQSAPAGTKVSPILAGLWGQALPNRPSLEDQMQAIQQATPEIKSISHFSFAWSEPVLERSRRTCKF